MDPSRRNRSVKEPSPDLGQRAFIGVCYPSKRLLRNERRRFMPASTTKLYTSWLACESLGEDHRFHAEYAVQGRTLYVAPMGHPLLGEDAFRPVLEDARGRRIEEVALVRRLLPGPRHPSTWAIGDVREAWGAPISDVCFHENYGTVEGAKGDAVSPSSSYFTVRRQVGLKVPAARGPAISLPPRYRGTYEFPITDPEGFLLHWLGERIGTEVRRRRARALKGTPVRFAEVPLREVLRTMNKKSSNILAELLLVHSARALRKPIDYERPQAAFAGVLGRIGVRDALLWDGSGVSRYNLVSPRGTVTLLESARKYASIEASLPVGGKDGTLADRKLPRRIHAKTGSLTGVQALAGYDDGAAFSVYINHGPTDERPMIDAIDRIVTGR